MCPVTRRGIWPFLPAPPWQGLSRDRSQGIHGALASWMGLWGVGWEEGAGRP